MEIHLPLQACPRRGHRPQARAALVVLLAALGLVAGTPPAWAESLEVRAKSGTIAEQASGAWVITLHGVGLMARRRVPELPDNLERRARSRIKTASMFSFWSTAGMRATRVRLSTRDTSAAILLDTLAYDPETRELVIAGSPAVSLYPAATGASAAFGNRLARPRLEFDLEDLDVEYDAPAPCEWCDVAPLGHVDNPLSHTSLAAMAGERDRHWSENYQVSYLGGPITSELCYGAEGFERFGIRAYAKKFSFYISTSQDINQILYRDRIIAWSNLYSRNPDAHWIDNILPNPAPRLVEGEIVCSTGPHALWPLTMGPGLRGLSVPCRPGLRSVVGLGPFVLVVNLPDLLGKALSYVDGQSGGTNNDGYWNYFFSNSSLWDREIIMAGLCTRA